MLLAQLRGSLMMANSMVVSKGWLAGALTGSDDAVTVVPLASRRAAHETTTHLDSGPVGVDEADLVSKQDARAPHAAGMGMQGGLPAAPGSQSSAMAPAGAVALTADELLGLSVDSLADELGSPALEEELRSSASFIMSAGEQGSPLSPSASASAASFSAAEVFEKTVKLDNVLLGEEMETVRIGRKLGSGSQGEVFLGWVPTTGECVALKRVAVQGSKAVERLLSMEVALLKQFSHPNVVRYLGLHEDHRKRVSYLVMEYVEGGSLDDAIKSGAVNEAKAR
jgi:hypothetical protein